MSVTINDKYAKPGGGLKGKIPFKSPTGQRYGHIPEAVYNILNKYGSDAHLYTFGPGVPILGPELVVNGDFNSPDGWVVGGGWSVSGGKAVASSVPAWLSMYRPIAAVKGRRYQVTMVVSSYVSGAVYAQIGTYPNSEAGAPRTSVGTYTDTLTALADSSLVELYSNGSGFSGSVESITVREILGYSNTYSGFVAGNYFDSAGTTHASVDGSVGLVLDAAGSVGAELVTNGDFASDTWWNKDAGVAIGGGVCSFSAAANGVGVWKPNLLAVNKYYQFTYTIVSVAAGGFKAMCGNTSGATRTTPGTYTEIIQAVSTVSGAVVASGTTTGVIDNISIKEVTGIHATQSTPGFKPTLRKGIVNLLTWSNDLTNAAWYVQGPSASKTGNLVSLSTPADHVLHALSGTTVGTPYTAYVTVSGDQGKQVDLCLIDGSGSYGTSSTPIVLTAVPTTYAVVRTNPLETSLIAGVRGAGVPTSLTLHSAGVSRGTLTAAQILAAGGIPLTTTAPASSQAGVNCLEFDGVDDRLAIPTIGFTDTLAVVLALNISRTNVVQVLFGSDAGGPQIYTAADGAVIFDKNGEGYIAGTPAGGITAGVPAVFTFLLSGGQALVRKNGVDVFSTPSARVFTSTVAHALGAQPSGQYPVKGVVYQALALKSSLTLSDVQLLEKQAAAAAGIQL